MTLASGVDGVDGVDGVERQSPIRQELLHCSALAAPIRQELLHLQAGEQSSSLDASKTGSALMHMQAWSQRLNRRLCPLS